MTINERLHACNVFNTWDKAVLNRNENEKNQGVRLLDFMGDKVALCFQGVLPLELLICLGKYADISNFSELDISGTINKLAEIHKSLNSTAVLER